ncbi:MAG: hypothetical protein ABIS86_18250 [Streptosporangiaceae bacterium]
MKLGLTFLLTAAAMTAGLVETIPAESTTAPGVSAPAVRMWVLGQVPGGRG